MTIKTLKKIRVGLNIVTLLSTLYLMVMLFIFVGFSQIGAVMGSPPDPEIEAIYYILFMGFLMALLSSFLIFTKRGWGYILLIVGATIYQVIYLIISNFIFLSRDVFDLFYLFPIVFFSLLYYLRRKLDYHIESASNPTL